MGARVSDSDLEDREFGEKDFSRATPLYQNPDPYEEAMAVHNHTATFSSRNAVSGQAHLPAAGPGAPRVGAHTALSGPRQPTATVGRSMQRHDHDGEST